MRTNFLASAAILAAASFHPVFFGEARAQSAASNDAEIAALKQQMLLLEKKLDSVQKQNAAKAKAVAHPTEKAETWGGVTSTTMPANAPSGVVVTMPGNRPTICTADNLNCISITSRLHFDVGAYDYRPDTAATNPQRLDDGINARRARIGVIGKFMGDWNYALVYDFGGSRMGSPVPEASAPPLPAAVRPSVSFPAVAYQELRLPLLVIAVSNPSVASLSSRAAIWIRSSPWTRRRVPTTSCSWSVPPLE
jgi:hypothetical protein